MNDLYDLYLYNINNPDSVIRVSQVSTVYSTYAMNSWWNLSEINDCVCIPSHEDAEDIFKKASIVDISKEALSEIIDKGGFVHGRLDCKNE